MHVQINLPVEDSEYVIQTPEKPKVCFGSGKPRDISKKNTSPFMRYHTGEDRPGVGPGSYNVLESFNAIKTKPCSHSISKRGYSGPAQFARPFTHTEHYPSPVDYLPSFPAKTKSYKHPLPSPSVSRRRSFYSDGNPGPGMYVSEKIQGITFENSFGGRVRMRLGVELKCCRRVTDACDMCGTKPTGDYWHLNNRTFLCRACMTREFQHQVKFKRRELKLFRKIRDCSHVHIHDGSDAKVWLAPPATVSRWERREAYLSAYLKD